MLYDILPYIRFQRRNSFGRCLQIGFRDFLLLSVLIFCDLLGGVPFAPLVEVFHDGVVAKSSSVVQGRVPPTVESDAET